MRVMVTGAAGFIGYHATKALLAAGHDVFGVDNLTPYYDVRLKRARLAKLAHSSFRFAEVDIADAKALASAAGPATDAILHLAAQAGVRYSLDHPFAYERSNLAGHLSVLEYARNLPALRSLVYASSSSVYGERADTPFRESDRCDEPASLYAATKRACELMSETYARLYGLRQIGVRFFTVYGPFGRPDMAYWTFLDAIRAGRPIVLFNQGDMERDFTFVDDVAPTLVRMIESPASEPGNAIYNLGNNQPVSLRAFVAAIENACGRKAEIQTTGMQKGDVSRTFADIVRAQTDFGFKPVTAIEEGIAEFVRWRMADWPH